MQSDQVIETVPVTRLRPYPGDARTHSGKQIRQIAESIRTFGFTNPVLISHDDEIIAGHGRVAAAKLIGLRSVPAPRLPPVPEVSDMTMHDAARRIAHVLSQGARIQKERKEKSNGG